MPAPATFGGFSAFSAPTQIVTGSPDLLSGRVADPAGDRVDAIHVYRDLDGNGVLDPGSDGLLLADTTPAVSAHHSHRFRGADGVAWKLVRPLGQCVGVLA